MASAVEALTKTDEVYAFQTFYRELGYYISHLEQYERALQFFDLAISKAPNDRRALMGRAWARSKASQYEGALNDIRTALGLDPDDIVMLGYKALNTFLNCEFEDAMVQNTRQIPNRKKPKYFLMGAMHCADAIENCLSERAGRPLRDHYLIIRKLAWKKNFEQQKGFCIKTKSKKKKKLGLFDQKVHHTRSVVPGEEKRRHDDTQSLVGTIYSRRSEQNVNPPHIKFPYRPLQPYTTNIENYVAEKYLHTLYKDKLFLQTLPLEPGVECPNETGTAKILQLAKLGFKIVNYKQELLRARRPFYFIKYAEATSTGALKYRQEQQLNYLKIVAKRNADLFVHKMKEALRGRKCRLVMDLSDKLRAYCEKTPKKILPLKNEYLNFTYDTICQAHFDLKRINPNQMQWDHEKRIHKLLGLPMSREPSKDSVVGQFKGLFIDWRKQIAIYNERLQRATNSKELCWLFHELSRFHTELKQYVLGRVYARKCMNEAKRIHKNKWVINALVLMMRLNMAQHSKSDARSDIAEAEEIAKKMHDENLLVFLAKCREVIDRINFDVKFGPKVQKEREMKILRVMSTGRIKEEAAHLFKMISTMPVTRRMSMMPGVKVEADDNEKKRSSSKRQSILPEPQKQLVFELSNSKIKEATKAEGAKGKVFAELIKYQMEKS